MAQTLRKMTDSSDRVLRRQGPTCPSVTACACSASRGRTSSSKDPRSAAGPRSPRPHAGEQPVMAGPLDMGLLTTTRTSVSWAGSTTSSPCIPRPYCRRSGAPARCSAGFPEHGFQDSAKAWEGTGQSPTGGVVLHVGRLHAGKGIRRRRSAGSVLDHEKRYEAGRQGASSALRRRPSAATG